LIVLNESDAAKTFTIKEKENGFTGTLNPGAVGTWVW
jgi:glucosylceramidase